MKKEDVSNCLDIEFQNICVSLGNYFGIDELPCKIFAILYLEFKEISLEDIAKKTGYSLSTVSKTMASLEQMLCLKKFRKPRSKKVFFIMEKDMKKFIHQILKKKLESLTPLKEGLPTILKKYETSKNKEVCQKLKLLRSLNKRVFFMDKALKIVIKMKGG